MGYYAKWYAEIVVPTEKQEQCLAAINALHTPEQLKQKANGGNWGGGVKREARYSWVENPSEGVWATLEEALRAWSLFDEVDEATETDEFLSLCGWHDSKIGQEQVLLEAIAPYCEDTDIECTGEGGAHWLWRIRGGKFEYLEGKVMYE